MHFKRTYGVGGRLQWPGIFVLWDIFIQAVAHWYEFVYSRFKAFKGPREVYVCIQFLLFLANVDNPTDGIVKKFR